MFMPGDEPEPISHTVTIFAAGVVYDFVDGDSVDEPSRIAVFRHSTSSRPGQFILLNPAEKRRTEISTERIEKLMAKLTGWAAEQEDKLLKFCADPEFEEAFDEETGRLTPHKPHLEIPSSHGPSRRAIFAGSLSGIFRLVRPTQHDDAWHAAAYAAAEAQRSF